MTAYLFLDTMTFLHFKPVTDIPWERLVPDMDVDLCITRVVVVELDKHKNSHLSGKVRERARRVLNEIETWSISPEKRQLRPGVTVRVHFDLPTRSLAQVLDPACSDDVLLATIKEFQDSHSTESVFLVTDDTGARIKARGLQIRCLVLDDMLRLPSDLDPLEAEIKRLKLEVARLSAAPLPALRITFADGEQYAKYTVAHPTDKHVRAERIRKELEAIQTQYPPVEAPANAETLRAPLNVDSLSRPLNVDDFARPAPTEVTRYNTAVPAFIHAYERYLNEVADYEERQKGIFQFVLILENEGRSPALDIDIDLHFPSGFVLLEKDQLTPSPDPPVPPPRPRTQMDLSAESMMRPLLPSFKALMTPSAVIPRLGPPPNVSPPKIIESDSYDMAFEVRRLKHGMVTELGTFALVYDEATAVRSFEAKYRINAENMPDDAVGILRFAFTPGTPVQS